MSNSVGLGAKLEALSLDEPGVADPFTARLARENCWSVDYATRAVSEYKRFVLLTQVAEHPVSPSDAVDQVWHLHLAYTKSYWEDLCQGLLGRPLHHEPSRGGWAEQAKYRNDYEKTLKAYRRAFDEEPPEDVWPSVQRRFAADQRFVRVSPATTIIVKRSSLRQTLAISTMSAILLTLAVPPLLDVPGPEFLALYFPAWVMCLALAWRVRRRPPSNAPASVTELQSYEAAYLAGDEPAVAGAAIAHLIATNTLALDQREATLFVRKPLPAGAHAIEKATYDQVSSATATSLAEAYAAAALAARDIGVRLRGLGLVLEHSSAVPLWIALVAPALGVIKLVSGIAQGKPIGLLVVLILIGGGVAVVYCWPRRALSSVGQAVLTGLRQKHADLSRPNPSNAALGDRVPLAVGLFGLAVLPNLGLGRLTDPLSRAHRSAWQLHGGGSGGGACGLDGCGGCGGGCGGCGGCG